MIGDLDFVMAEDGGWLRAAGKVAACVVPGHRAEGPSQWWIRLARLRRAFSPLGVYRPFLGRCPRLV